MSQTANSQANSSRAYALARRKAMSSAGKAAIKQSSASNGNTSQSTTSPPPGQVAVATSKSGNSSGSVRAASLARRHAMSTKGKAAVSGGDRTRTIDDGADTRPVKNPEPVSSTDKSTDCGCGCNGDNKDSGAIADTSSTLSPSRKRLTRRPKVAVQSNSCRAGSLARRKAMSSRGKAGISKSGMSAAQSTRAANPDMSSRELARTLREQKSRNGSAGLKKSEPARPMRQPRKPGAAEDASWKVGESSTSHGQTVTGTMVGRAQTVTGDEASTCRDVTGTEYMGADIFQQFCQTDPVKGVTRSGISATGLGNSVTGNQVGRSQRVTGDEPGTCKNVTGTEYVGSGQSSEFCGTPSPARAPLMAGAKTQKDKTITGNNVGRSERVTGDEPGMTRELTGTQYTGSAEIGKSPRKVGISATLRGGSVTGTMVGRREKMTGDEPGSCRAVTGDDYVGQEQYSSFCSTTPAPTDQKVGVSPTNKGNTVTGTMTGRASVVTGDEPGTCKAVTGTPYAGLDQASNWCEPTATAEIQARTRPLASTPGPVMTGQQPGVGGVMTGDMKGACEPVSGTPYVGADQFADACPAAPATTSSPDFPQPMGNVPWGQFSVTQPSGGAAEAAGSTGVTGNRYEARKDITGPFGMAGGKVTGTEEVRFGSKAQSEELRPVMTEEHEGRIKSRITGEGQDAGLKITGDDWERNEQVTGTEGRSATRRNPTMRMGMLTATQVEQKRNEELPVPNSKVTGGSGNTDKGSLITYSGGARG